jgi:predicted Zn finger-like uncharacterized protein
MKFVCEQCGSKYSIADDRVVNKALKIKCKKCSNIITVSDPKVRQSKLPRKAFDSVSLNPEPLTRPSSPPPVRKKKRTFPGDKLKDSIEPKGLPKPKAPPDLLNAVKRSEEAIESDKKINAGWFVGIDNVPKGPMSALKIRSFRRTGKVNDDSLVWKEGMIEWTPLGQVSELVALLARIDETGARSEKAETEDFALPKLGIVEEQAPSDSSQLKDRSLGVEPDRIDASKPESGAESSFFNQPFASPPQSMTREKGGIADAMGIEIEGDVGTLRSLVPPKPAGGLHSRMILLAAVGFFAVSLVTLGVALFSDGDSGETKTSVQTVEKVIERVVYLDRPAGDSSLLSITERPRTEKDEEQDTEEGLQKSKLGKGVSKSLEDKSGEPDARTKELIERMGVSAPTGGAPVGGEAKKQAPNRASGVGLLTANQVKAVVDSNKRELKSCYERALKQGEAPDDRDIRVDFKVTVGSSGMVKRVDIAGEGAGVSNLSSCLKRSVGKWVFPQSSQDSPIEFPFVFSPR